MIFAEKQYGGNFVQYCRRGQSGVVKVAQKEFVSVFINGFISIFVKVFRFQINGT